MDRLLNPPPIAVTDPNHAYRDAAESVICGGSQARCGVVLVPNRLAARCGGAHREANPPAGTARGNAGGAAEPGLALWISGANVRRTVRLVET